MTEELKPCPFCGEEHISVAYTGYEDEGCVLYTLGCSTTNCPGHISGSWRYFNLERAAEAWNRRAERTCKMELVKRGPIYSVWRFSCCGYEHSENDTDGGATELPGTRCPKCGAVVNE